MRRARVQSQRTPSRPSAVHLGLPVPSREVGLNMIPFLRDRVMAVPWGSRITPAPLPGLAAAVLEADVLEIHVTLSRRCSADVPASVTVVGSPSVPTDPVHRTHGRQPVDKDASAQETSGLHALFTKSVVARR